MDKCEANRGDEINKRVKVLTKKFKQNMDTMSMVNAKSVVNKA
jgi:hypothetical protein